MHLTGARDSPLSRAQFEELRGLVSLELQPVFVKTTGDLDKQTSLRSLDKTDFFTKELDELLLRGEIRLAVHSAKDLPDPLPKGLVVAMITEGVDPRDALVVREVLPEHPLIATSSVRREEAVLQILPDATFCDIRGTIGERLEKLYKGEVDGVVIAEAALIRLKHNPKRLYLPGETVPLQGKLAVVVREEDREYFENALART